MPGANFVKGVARHSQSSGTLSAGSSQYSIVMVAVGDNNVSDLQVDDVVYVQCVVNNQFTPATVPPGTAIPTGTQPLATNWPVLFSTLVSWRRALFLLSHTVTQADLDAPAGQLSAHLIFSSALWPYEVWWDARIWRQAVAAVDDLTFSVLSGPTSATPVITTTTNDEGVVESWIVEASADTIAPTPGATYGHAQLQQGQTVSNQIMLVADYKKAVAGNTTGDTAQIAANATGAITSLVYGVPALNRQPSKPLPVNPPANGIVDLNHLTPTGQFPSVQFQHIDPDGPQDLQTGFRWARRVNTVGSTKHWWNGTNWAATTAQDITAAEPALTGLVLPTHFLDLTYTWPAGSYTQITQAMIIAVAGDPDGYFYSHYFRFTDNPAANGGYVGLQTEGTEPLGRIATFSIWGATGGLSTAYSAAFSELGTGWTVRIPYQWQEGATYTVKVVKGTTNGAEQDWIGSIIDSGGTETVIGTLQVPTARGNLANTSTVFHERYTGALDSWDSVLHSDVTFLTPAAVGGSGSVAPSSHSSVVPTGTGAPTSFSSGDISGGVRSQTGLPLVIGSRSTVRFLPGLWADGDWLVTYTTRDLAGLWGVEGDEFLVTTQAAPVVNWAFPSPGFIITDTNIPLFQWVTTAVQSNYRIRVFKTSQVTATGFSPTTAAGAVLDSGLLAGAATSWLASKPLDNLTQYTAYIWIKVGGKIQSNVARVDFNIDISASGLPEVTPLLAGSPTGQGTDVLHVQAAVQGTDNALTDGEARFTDAGAWVPDSNCTVTVDTVNGLATLTSVVAGPMAIKTARKIPVTGGEGYSLLGEMKFIDGTGVQQNVTGKVRVFNDQDQPVSVLQVGDVLELGSTAVTPPPPPPAQPYGLYVSTNADRSNPQPIVVLGQPDSPDPTVTGRVAIFVSPPDGVSKVDFLLDGVLHSTDTVPPFDFAGGSAALAVLFDTTATNPDGSLKVTNGTHTIGATVYTADQTISILGSVNVANQGTGAPIIDGFTLAPAGTMRVGDGKFVTCNAHDAQGLALSFSWSWTGYTVETPTIINAGLQTCAFSASVAGGHGIQCVVTNSAGRSAVGTIGIDVLPAVATQQLPYESFEFAGLMSSWTTIHINNANPRGTGSVHTDGLDANTNYKIVCDEEINTVRDRNGMVFIQGGKYVEFFDGAWNFDKDFAAAAGVKKDYETGGTPKAGNTFQQWNRWLYTKNIHRGFYCEGHHIRGNWLFEAINASYGVADTGRGSSEPLFRAQNLWFESEVRRVYIQPDQRTLVSPSNDHDGGDFFQAFLGVWPVTWEFAYIDVAGTWYQGLGYIEDEGTENIAKPFNHGQMQFIWDRNSQGYTSIDYRFVSLSGHQPFSHNHFYVTPGLQRRDPTTTGFPTVGTVRKPIEKSMFPTADTSHTQYQSTRAPARGGPDAVNGFYYGYYPSGEPLVPSGNDYEVPAGQSPPELNASGLMICGDSTPGLTYTSPGYQ